MGDFFVGKCLSSEDSHFSYYLPHTIYDYFVYALTFLQFEDVQFRASSGNPSPSLSLPQT